MKHKILIITSILPVQELEFKKNENDILLDVEERILKNYSDIEFNYLFVLPFSLFVIGIFSKKWRDFYNLKNKKNVNVRGRNVYILPIIILPKKTILRNIIYKISFFLYKKRIHEIYNKIKPSLIHAQNVEADLFVADYFQQKYNVPFIVTLRLFNNYLPKFVTNKIEKAQKVIALSYQQHQNYHLLSNNLVYLPHGIDDSFINESKEIPSDQLRLVTVCRLIKLKNISQTLKVLANLKREFQYDIYGEGPEYKSLAAEIELLGLGNKVNLMGQIENNKLPQLLTNYNLFLMISSPETFGRVYFEAMAAGVPVVAAKNTGIDGIITNEKHGYLLNYGEEKELFNLLNNLSLDQLLRISPSCIEFAKEFSWNKILFKLHNTYTKINEK
jgi:glycosyltransferase involved in cell wall biosynthesis